MRTVLWLGFAVVAGLLIGSGSPHWYFGGLAFAGLMLVGAFVRRGSTGGGRMRP